MAHQSVLIATKGAIDANSYQTLAEAEEAIEHEMLHATGWVGTDPIKEAALIWAARILDYSFHWKGYKADDRQAMAWPRYNAYSRYGRLLGYNYSTGTYEIPHDVMHAQLELAIKLISSDVTRDADSKGLKSLQVDVIKMEFITADAPKAIDRGIRAMMEDYGTYIDAEKSSSMVRLVRG